MSSTELQYSELDVSTKNIIASALGSKIRDHIPHLTKYRYFVMNDEFIILTTYNHIIAKNIRTTTFIQSITDYKLLEPKLKRDEIGPWEDAGFIINKRLLKIANEDNVIPTSFPMKYSSEELSRQHNKKILDKYKIPRGLNQSAFKAASKLMPGIGSSNKNLVFEKVNKIIKDGTSTGELQALIEQASKKKKVVRYIK